MCINEFEITKYANEFLRIAPKPIEVIHSKDRIGAVYERLSGKTMLKLMLSKPWRLSKYSKMLARCHVAIQKKASLSAITVKEKLRRDIENVSLLSLEEKQSVNEYLDTLPDGDSICHFDFHPDNIMVFNDQYYVIDWMTGCVGNPLSDVARTALILNHAEIPRVPFLVKVLVKAFQLVCPGKVFERKYNADSVVKNGAGIAITAKGFSPDTILKAIHDLTSDESFRTNAEKLGKSLCCLGGAAAVLDYISSSF